MFQCEQMIALVTKTLHKLFWCNA